MHKLLPLVEATLADPLSHARENVAPIGYVGFDFPLDIQFASPRPFCHLPWRIGAATPNADRWLESSFPGWARSILQNWIEGVFDIFESVVFTRGDDASQRLYYYVCELQRRDVIAGPKPLILDVACIARETSIRHCESAIKELLRELDIDEDKIRAGIVLANERRKLLTEMESNRVGLGHYYENISRAVLFKDLFIKKDSFQAPEAVVRPCVLLAGSAPADDSIHRSVENVGWNVGAELHSRSLLRYGDPIGEFEENPVGALAKVINQNTFTIRSFCNRTEQLVSKARQLKVDAVLVWVTEEDESLAWHIAKQRQELELAGIPHLILTRRRWDGNDDTVERISAFLETQPTLIGKTK